ncbi:hypothetical protein [Psychrobacter sp. KCTC 72983]|uniref:hypothetical protein n=1 Tax=Psychrobacter sp. KCTC 72983 TaxID=2733866 RepID=UPI001644540B|nr:hypothetical protein [Psychrobacter sp. KCTC 72983]
MTHKNWDNVRDRRLYSYMNDPEHDRFEFAMRLAGISQEATAIRQFVLERSDQIIINHQHDKFKQNDVTVTTVKLRFPSGKFTATDSL